MYTCIKAFTSKGVNHYQYGTEIGEHIYQSLPYEERKNFELKRTTSGTIRPDILETDTTLFRGSDSDIDSPALPPVSESHSFGFGGGGSGFDGGGASSDYETPSHSHDSPSHDSGSSGDSGGSDGGGEGD